MRVCIIFCNLTVYMLITSSSINAEEIYFNPAFLSENENKIDLSIYEQGKQQPGDYRTDIFLNSEFKITKVIKFVQAKDNYIISGSNKDLYPCLDQEFLEKLGVTVVNPEVDENNCVIIQSINNNASVKYNFLRQKLDLEFPQTLIQKKVREEISSNLWDSGITAGFINYSFNSNINSFNQNYFVGLTTGFNIGDWRFRNNSSYVYTHANNINYDQWNTINSYVERPIANIQSNLLIGDGSSTNTVFDGLSFRGISLSSANEMLPSSSQGFAPELSGIAQTRAKVIVRQNGNIIYQTFVTPGPFTLSDLYSTSSSGDLEMTIEESNGVTQTKLIPYSTVPILQRAKKYTYSTIVGKFRSGNSAQDDPFFTQGTLIYGLNNYSTLYSGFQLSKNYKAVLIGIGGNLGHFGAFSLDLTHANSTLFNDEKYSGQSIRFLYSKSLTNYGTTLKLLGYRYSTKGFYTFNDVTYKDRVGYNYDYSTDESGNLVHSPYSYYNLANNKKGRYQASISQNFKNYGSLYTSYDVQNYWNTSFKSKNTSVGYSFRLNKASVNLSYSLSSVLGFQDTDNIYSLAMSFSLDDFLRKPNKRTNSAFVTTNITNSSLYGESKNVGISGTALENNNLRYSLNAGYNNNISTLVSYQGGYGTFGTGYSYNDGTNNFSLSANGSAVAHVGGVTFGQQLTDSSILIKADKAAGIRVQNKQGVKTDSRGYAIIPSADAYKWNRIALDLKNLDNKIEVVDNIKEFVPTKGAIVLANFETKLGYRSLVKLSENNVAVPFGANVVEESSQSQGIVGEDGAVYLTGLPAHGLLKVQKGSAENSCYSTYEIPEADFNKNVILLNLECNK